MINMTNEIFKNEMMSNEQLEQVAGGSNSQTEVDRVFLKKLGFPTGGKDGVRDVYNYYGVQFRGYTSDDNEYKVNGNKVSQVAAMGYVLKRGSYTRFDSSRWADEDYVKSFLEYHFKINVA